MSAASTATMVGAHIALLRTHQLVHRAGLVLFTQHIELAATAAPDQRWRALVAAVHGLCAPLGGRVLGSRMVLGVMQVSHHLTLTDLFQQYQLGLFITQLLLQRPD